MAAQANAVWSTAKINNVLERLKYNEPADMSCFHEKDIELKAGQLFYQSTAWEQEEFNKCSNDALYFVEKYCKFLTDKGRSIVTLMDHQKDIIDIVTEEVYIPALDDNGPKNRDAIIMAARQTGKCLIFSNIEMQDSNSTKYKIPINLLYYFNKPKLTLLEKIKLKLMIWLHKIDND